MSRGAATIDLFRKQPTDTRADQAGVYDAATLQEVLQSDLGFHGTSGKFATHGWHPFPAKFPPQLPHLFIETLSVAGETVFDLLDTLVRGSRLRDISDLAT